MQQIETFVCRDLNIAAFRVIHQAPNLAGPWLWNNCSEQDRQCFLCFTAFTLRPEEGSHRRHRNSGTTWKSHHQRPAWGWKGSTEMPLFGQEVPSPQSCPFRRPDERMSTPVRGRPLPTIRRKIWSCPLSLPGIPGTVKSCLHYYAENSVLSQLLALLSPANL